VDESKTTLFTFVSDYPIIAYIPVEILDILSVILLTIWLGWFQQNTNTKKAIFSVVTDSIVPCTKLLFEPESVSNYIFFAIIAFLIPIFCFNSKLLTVYHNRWAIGSSFLGTFISIILLGWLVIMRFNCNTNGYGGNYCNSKLFCAAFNPTGLFRNNPQNLCTNTYDCPTMIPEGELAPNLDYIILLIITVTWVVSNLAVLIYSIVIEPSLAKHREDGYNVLL
jgi:hypothetical protein